MKAGRSHTRSARTHEPGRGALLLAWLRNHAQVARNSLRRILGTPWQSGLMIAVIAIAGSLPASLYQLSEALERFGEGIDRSAGIQVFFSTEAEPQTIAQLADSWRQLAEVDAVEVIDPEEGRQAFQSYSGLGSVLELLEENPLPSVARLTPAPALIGDVPTLETLVAQLRSTTAVDQVQFDFAWLERLEAILTLIERTNGVIGLMLGAGIVLVLINSVRLMIDSRKEEIVIVKLVGGTNEFVRRPLLYTGFWLGLLGGTAAVVIADLAGLAMGPPLQFLLGSYSLGDEPLGGLDIIESLCLILLCAFLGLAGAWIAVAQHLGAIEPR